MESAEVIIARLVLGYLKREHCKKAYEQFLRTSVSLGEHSSNRSKFISTRFIGLTLEEILTEYFEISRIVQGRLEPTDYFIEGHSKTSLVKQLLYLLNKAQSSRASTPCPRSPLDSNLDETSPSYIDHVSDVEATPAHSLPGNTQYERDESYTYKSSRRKAQSKYVKVGAATSSPFMEKEDVSEIFAQTLLGKREFHEKIAQTINKVVEKQFKNSGELDETIKTVIKKTEEDPIFDRILEEIIGSSNHLDDDNGAFETGSTTSSNAHKTDRRSQETEADDENVCRTTEYQSVEEQNNDAVQSIVANSKMNANAQQVGEVPNNAQQMVERQNNEVVVFDGSLDKYLRSDSSNLSVLQTQPIQNPLYINTTATLFIPTNPPTYSINDSRQQLMVQPTVNWSAPGIITETDILTMPTVILSDPGSNRSDTTPVSKNESVSKKHVKPILPTTAKPRIEIAANLSEYLKLNDIGDAKPKTGLKKVHYPKSTQTVTSAIPTTLKNTKETISEKVTLANSNDLKPSEEKKETKREQAPGPCMPTTCTPPPLQQIKKATPKSGSHVRNLDFSSPPKITSTHKKTARLKLGSKSPQFVHKKQAAKLLFKESGVWDADLRAICPQDDKQVSSTPKAKRVLSTGSIKKRTNKKETLKPKRKQVSCGDKKTKKRVKITDVLNTTEQVAAQLEAALQTPEKTEQPKKDLEKSAEKPTVPTKSESEKKSSDKSTVVNEKPNENKQNKESLENSVTEQNIETPETVREIVAHPVKANRNIMPLLETPLKDNVIPKTPGLSTPSDMNLSALNFTPFTKMLEDNLKGIDIDSLPTPSMPITPSFPPFTPTVDLVSPFSNRPTDYSTSSSYYQPSDNEQNKSLEAQLREAEKKSPIVDKMKSIFNKNVIGKKNLNLMRRDTTKSSDTSLSSTSISEDDSNSLWGEKWSNDTVILKKMDAETPRRMYSLRNRSVSLETAKKDSKNDSRKDGVTNKRNSDSKKDSKNSSRDEETATIKEPEVRNKKSNQKIKKITVPTKENEKKSNLKRVSKKTGLKTSNKKKIVFENDDINQETKCKGKEEQENMKKTFPKTKKLSTPKQEKSKRLSVEVESSEVIENKLKDTVSKSGNHEYDEKLETAPEIVPVAEHAANEDVEDTDTSTKVIQNTVEVSEAQEKRKSSTIGKEVQTAVHKDLQRSTNVVQETVEVSANSETGLKNKSFTTSEEVEADVTENLCNIAKAIQTTLEVSASLQIQELSTTSEGVNKDLGKSSKVEEIMDVSASSEIGEKKTSSETGEKKKSVTFSEEDSNNVTKVIQKAGEASTSLENREKRGSSTSKDVNKDFKKSTKVHKSPASFETGEKKKPTTTSEKVKGNINKNSGQSTKLSTSSEVHEKKGSSTSKEVKDVKRASITADSLKSDKDTPRVASKANLDKKSSVLREMEEKRLRTINKLKKGMPETKDTPTSKKQANGKFKIKPIPNVTCVRKKPRKSDSPQKRVQYKSIKHLFSSDEDSDGLANDTPVKPNNDESKSVDSKTENVSDKSESDVEAQNLIEGLKERGIHLMHNKSPKKKCVEGAKEECTTAADSPNCSSSRIDTFVRDTYDTKCFEVEDEHIIFDEEQVISTSNSYQIDEHVPQAFIGKVYLEGLGEEVDVPLTFSPFESLLEITPEENLNNAGGKSDLSLSKKIIIKEMVIIKDDFTYERILNNDNLNRNEDRNRECERNKSIENTVTAEEVEQKPKRITDYNVSEQMRIEDDDLMNFASTGKEKDFQERSPSPIIGTKKRKLSDGSIHHTEKKAKKLLKNLDVDSFLNNIHAGTNFQLKK